MIVVKIYGGLGNQLFQYSFGRYIALKYNSQLKLDVEWFHSPDKPELYKLNRHFELDNFNLQFNGFYKQRSLKAWFFEKIFRSTTFAEKIFDESGYKYVLEGGDNIILDGYWGSYLDYLFNPEFKRLITKDLTLKQGVLNGLHGTFAQQITQSKNPVSISVRRGDYTGIPLFGTLGMDYYKKAIGLINGKVEDPNYFFFSDDMEWVAENFAFLENKVLVQTGNVVNDFNLISRCRHNIIANSTYSWWGAFLNNNEAKIVIAPKIWFLLDEKAQAFYEKSRCMPAEWVRL